MLRNRIAVKAAFFLNGFVYANWASRLPRIQEQYAADNGTIGMVLLAMSVGAVAAMPFTGWVIIKKGSRSVTLASVCLYCLLIPLIPLMAHLAPLVMLFVLIGIANGTLDIAMNAQAVIVEQRYKRPIMTSFHAFFSIGMASGAWCGALFAELSKGLAFHFAVVSAVSLLLVLWVRFNLVPDKPARDNHTDDPVFRIPNRSLLSVGLIAFCCMLGEGAISDWSVNYMENFAKAPKVFAPLALSAFGTAMTLGRLFGDRFRARWGDGVLIAAGSIIATTGIGMALALPTPYIALTGFFLVGVGLSTIVPITYSIAGNSRDLPSGVGLAMVTTVGYSGFLFGPPLIGILADTFNLRIALLVIVFLFIAMTLLGLLKTSSRRAT